MSLDTTLTTEENSLLKTLQGISQVNERLVQIMYYAATKISRSDPYGFGKVFDSAEAYSEKLHQTLESLQRKGYLERKGETLRVLPR